MVRARGMLVVALATGCSSIFGLEEPSRRIIDASESDAPGDAAPDAPFPTGVFGMPVRINELSAVGARDDDPSLTGDLLEIFFESDRGGNAEIYTSVRSTAGAPWPMPEVVVALSSPTALDSSPEISTDGLTIYFASDRSGAAGIDIYKSTRTARDQPWTMPSRVVELSTPAGDHPCNYEDGQRRMHMYSSITGTTDVYLTTRASATDPWGTPAVVSGLTGAGYQGECFVDATGAMWYTTDAAPGLAVWRAEPDASDGFTNGARVIELDSGAADNDPWLSPDGHTIVFTSQRAGDLDIYVATR